MKVKLRAAWEQECPDYDSRKISTSKLDASLASLVQDLFSFDEGIRRHAQCQDNKHVKGSWTRLRKV